MAKYIVLAASCHSDKRQQVFRNGDVVSDTDFHEGHAEKFLEDGFLREFTEEDELKDNSETGNTGNADGGEAGDTAPDYEAMSKKELKDLLDARQVPYDIKANKKTLIELLTAEA